MHRIAFIERNGWDPGEYDLEVMHLCDNPPCVNPEHLEAGTHDENMRQMSERNSRFAGRGIRQAIYNRYKEGGISQRKLAKEFKVSKTLVGQIVLRQVPF